MGEGTESSYPKELAWLESGILAVQAWLAISAVARAAYLPLTASQTLPSNQLASSFQLLISKDLRGKREKDEVVATTAALRKAKRMGR